MALTPGKAAGYYEWKTVADERAVVVFRIREVPEPFEYTPEGRKTRMIHPVVADFVVLSGSQEKTVVRDESIWGSGFRGLRKFPPLPGQEPRDVVCVMGWKRGDVDYVIADQQPVDSDAYRIAVEVFKATNGDPYTAAEKAANPTGTLTPAASSGGDTGGNRAQPGGDSGGNVAAPVGGPAGPQWGGDGGNAAVSNGQPVAAGSAAW